MKTTLLFQNQPAVGLADDQNKIAVSPGHGARILRIHDVGATRDALAVWQAGA